MANGRSLIKMVGPTAIERVCPSHLTDVSCWSAWKSEAGLTLSDDAASQSYRRRWRCGRSNSNLCRRGSARPLHLFAIESIVDITATTSDEIIAALLPFAALALHR